MATIKAVVFKHHKKDDGTFNVKIRVTHHRDIAYIATPYFVVRKELNRNYEISDYLINTEVSNYVNSMRKSLIELGVYVDGYTAKSLAEYLKNCSTRGIKSQIVDFVSFMDMYVHELKDSCSGSYKNYAPALRRIKEFAGTSIPFENLTPSFFERFEKYLSDNGTGKRGISLYMSCYRKIFNEARKRLNDDDKGVIIVKNYPFSRYKVPEIPVSKERAAGLEIVKQLYEYIPSGVEDTLAKDMFFISFYLVGMNAVDIYQLENQKNGMIVYQRAKTKGKRADNAEISIRIEPEAIPLIEKYRDTSGEKYFNLHKRYKSVRNFNKALSNGFIEIRKKLGVDNLTFYSARHSWATIASYNCDITEDKIARCLNHVSMNYRVTSRYIKKDWSVIWDANRKVLDLFDWSALKIL